MEADGLTNEQTEKVLQFQDLTGIEDMNVCRDVLIRHQWDLEVCICLYAHTVNVKITGSRSLAVLHTVVAARILLPTSFVHIYYLTTKDSNHFILNSF